jgi:Barstar (barnase inhibitor)
MPIVQIPLDRIHDWETFHTVFAEVLGFPDYYGRNMNAWIDCMTSLDDPDMYPSPLAKGDVLTLDIEDVHSFKERCPEQFAVLIDCSAFVNYRRIRVDQAPILALSFHP